MADNLLTSFVEIDVFKNTHGIETTRPTPIVRTHRRHIMATGSDSYRLKAISEARRQKAEGENGNNPVMMQRPYQLGGSDLGDKTGSVLSDI